MGSRGLVIGSREKEEEEKEEEEKEREEKEEEEVYLQNILWRYHKQCFEINQMLIITLK